jgi:hypothetical protein
LVTQTPPAPTERRVENRPGAPGYDPTKFLGAIPPRKLFSQEPRNEQWAAKVEEFLSTQMQQDMPRMFKDFTIGQIECRTTMCRVRWEADPTDHVKIYNMIHTLYGPSGGGHGAAPNEMYLIFQGGVLGALPAGDAEALFVAIAKKRQSRLESVRRNLPRSPSMQSRFVEIDRLPER